MIVSTEGIVVRTLDYRESSKIVNVFTESDGLVSLVAKGVRKSRKAIGVLESLNILSLTFYKYPNKDIFLLGKYETISSCFKILKSFPHTIVGITILDLIQATQQQNSPNSDLYSKLKEILEALKNQELVPFNILLKFLLILVDDLGLNFLAQFSDGNFSESELVFFNLKDGKIENKLIEKNTFTMQSKILKKLYNFFIQPDKYLMEDYFVGEEKQILLTLFESFLSLHLDRTISFSTLKNMRDVI